MLSWRAENGFGRYSQAPARIDSIPDSTDARPVMITGKASGSLTLTWLNSSRPDACCR